MDNHSDDHPDNGADIDNAETSDEIPLAHLADPAPGPLPSADTLTDIVGRYRRRRTQALGAALVIALLAGPAVGFAVGRADDRGTPQTVAAGGGTAPRPEAPVPRSDTASGSASAYAFATGGAVSSMGSPTGPGFPKLNRVLMRDTADGIRVRAFLQSFQVKGAVLEPGMAKECMPEQFLQAEVSDAGMVGQVQSPTFASTPDPVTVVGIGSAGDAEGSPVAVVSVRTAAQVARVKMTLAGGPTDEMVPAGGWAVLAVHGSLAQQPINGSVVALDADGKVLGTIGLSRPEPRLPDTCMKPAGPLLPPPPLPAAGSPPPVAASTPPASVAATTPAVPGTRPTGSR